jgi:hypothetical protein
MTKHIPWILGFIVLLGVAEPAFAENKFAFVVGVNAYPNLAAEAQLERAVADANAVGDALQSLGFDVTRLTHDQTLRAILDAFETFKSKIKTGDTVLFYYAGHGVSLDDGNYLIPSDVPLLGPNDERMAKHWTISEKDFSDDIRSTGAHVAVMVIDACRNNPFPPKGTRALGASTRGLARMAPSLGVFTLYSAREGQLAIDRLPGDADANSVFTRVFVKDLKTRGLSLSELGDRVRDEVADLAKANGRDQVPAIYNDLVGSRSVFLAGPSADGGASKGDRPTASGGARLELALVAKDSLKNAGASLHGFGDDDKTYRIERDITLPGDIERVEATVDTNGNPAIDIHLAAAAIKRMNASAGLLDRQLALVLDGRTVLSVATIKAPLGAEIQVTGRFTLEEVKRLVDAVDPSGSENR